MKRTSHQIALLAASGSVALLAGAWVFQVLGYSPCKMCIWQRYPHGVAIFIGLLVLFGLRHQFVYLLGAVAASVTSGIGIYHTGVERDWWEGPTSCTGSGLDMSSFSAEQLLSTSTAEKLVMCDEVVWEFLGLSMASWNAIISLLIAITWITAAQLAQAKYQAA